MNAPSLFKSNTLKKPILNDLEALRWEFMKKNKKVTKQENKNSTKKAMKKTRKKEKNSTK